VVLEGADPGKVVEIGEEPLTIGRDARQTIVFATDSEVSRLHARVLRRNNEILAEDAGSTNGTFVGPARLTADPTVLREGDVLRVGRQLLKYERRSRRDVERATKLNRDLLKASNYVLSLHPLKRALSASAGGSFHRRNSGAMRSGTTGSPRRRSFST
jgi:pSer/pThr/pTyr-binding forkhead associated (FHA) protein